MFASGYTQVRALSIYVGVAETDQLMRLKLEVYTVGLSTDMYLHFMALTV